MLRQNRNQRFYIRQVSGHSMEPTLHSGQIVIAAKKKTYNHGDVVIATTKKIEVVKRLERVGKTWNLTGDNHDPSHMIQNVDINTVRAKVLWPKI